MKKLIALTALAVFCAQAETGRSVSYTNGSDKNTREISIKSDTGGEVGTTLEPKTTKSVTIPGNKIAELTIIELDPKGTVTRTEIWFARAKKSGEKVSGASAYFDRDAKLNTGNAFTVNKYPGVGFTLDKK